MNKISLWTEFCHWLRKILDSPLVSHLTRTLQRPILKQAELQVPLRWRARECILHQLSSLSSVIATLPDGGLAPSK